MKNLFYTFTLILFTLQACSSNQSVFKLSAEQSMLIVGKGKGQDAAINPYADDTSIAVIKNPTNEAFFARIQRQGRLIDEINIAPKSTKEVVLQVGYELYLDSTEETKAQISFKRYKG